MDNLSIHKRKKVQELWRQLGGANSCSCQPLLLIFHKREEAKPRSSLSSVGLEYEHVKLSKKLLNMLVLLSQFLTRLRGSSTVAIQYLSLPRWLPNCWLFLAKASVSRIAIPDFRASWCVAHREHRSFISLGWSEPRDKQCWCYQC